MLSIFVGDDRVSAEKAVKTAFKGQYEVFEGDNLSVDDLPNIFWGTSLFGDVRQILLKDVAENTSVWNKIPDYLAGSKHKIIIWETKIDKRSTTYKALVKEKVEVREFLLKKRPEEKLVFGIFDTAKRNGGAAIRDVEKIELSQDAFMFFGLLVNQAMKQFELWQGEKEKKVLKTLAEADMRMKTVGIEPWEIIKVALLDIYNIYNA